MAGKDRLILAPAGNAPAIPLDTLVSIEVILNDQLDPMEVRILSFKPAGP